MTDRLKLRTNVALFGVAQYANYWKGKDHTDDKGVTKRLPDQLELKGRWAEDPAQLVEQRLFLPIPLLGVMLEIGLLRQDQGTDSYGNPRYTVLNQTRQIRVIKIEDPKDAKKKRTFIGWADAGHPETVAAAPAAAQPAPARTAPEPPGRPAVTQPKLSEEERAAKLQKAHRRRLGHIAETAGCAWRAAAHELDLFLEEKGMARGALDAAVYLDLVARIAAHLCIQAEHENLDIRRQEKKAVTGEASLGKGSPHGAARAQGVQDHGPRPVQPLPPIDTKDPYTEQEVPGLTHAEQPAMGLDGFDELPDDDELPF